VNLGLNNQQEINLKIENEIINIIHIINPNNTKELIDICKKRTGFNENEILKALFNLENNGKIYYEKTNSYKQIPSYFGYKSWYFFSVIFALTSVCAVLFIPNIYPIAYARNILGLSLVFFMPGYAFIKMVFPSQPSIKFRDQELNTFERFALSICMSLALSPLIILTIYFTLMGIDFVPIALSLFTITFIFASIGLIREISKNRRSAIAKVTA
jgi:hypothetical protein